MVSAYAAAYQNPCRLQDFPKLLPSSARVGFTVINQVWAAYSPVKNSPGDARAKAASGNPSHSATAAELDIYKTNCMVRGWAGGWSCRGWCCRDLLLLQLASRVESLASRDLPCRRLQMLRMLGAAVADPTPVEFNGIAGLELWPRVSLSPLFAATFDELEAKVSCSEVHIGADTALVVEAGDASIQGLDLQRGALEVRAPLGARVKIHRLGVNNEGWAWEPVSQDQGCSEEEYIRWAGAGGWAGSWLAGKLAGWLARWAGGLPGREQQRTAKDSSAPAPETPAALRCCRGFRVKRTASVAVEAESPGDYEVSDPPSPPGEGSGSSLTPILRGEGAP